MGGPTTAIQHQHQHQHQSTEKENAMPWDRAEQRSPDERGYGYAHRQARKAAAKRHRPDDPCARCGQPLGPMGPHLHLDHNADRTGYLGFSHGAGCNARAGAQEGRRRQVAASCCPGTPGTVCTCVTTLEW